MTNFYSIYPKNRKSSQKGFTLIEMIVSVGVFTIVMTIAIGALLIVYDTYRKTRTLKNAMENVNIITESMIKRIRTGEDFRCLGITNANSCTAIQFKGEDDYYYQYEYMNTWQSIRHRKCDDVNCVGEQLSVITSEDVRFTEIRFFLYGVGDPLVQDAVTVVMTGVARIPGKQKFDSSFNIQTTISKRLLDTF